VPARALLTFAQLSSHEQVGTLVGAIQQLSLARSLGDIQAVVRSAARRLAAADGATVVLRDGHLCHYVDEDAIGPLWKGQRFPIDHCISGWVMRHRRPAVIADIFADDRVPHEAYRATFVKSLALVPIRALDPIGAIGIYWATHHEPSATDIEMLQALADSTAVAFENVRVVQALEEAQVETLQRLALAAEYRDDASSGHPERVAHTSARLAEQLGWSAPLVTLVRHAAPLHDIGKLAVPDTVLSKPGKLTVEEREQMKGHAAAGAAILAGSHAAVLKMAAEISLTHHEWWDGSGYPSGLVGEAIPMSGRIVALADVFDALAHSRPYKPAWPLQPAVDEIGRLSGVQFDPAVVEAFRSIDAAALIADPTDSLGQSTGPVWRARPDRRTT
jgi:response regulator RpfG family c-di-GMP phosphodiesterase